LLPETGLPEGSLTHHSESIRQIHQLLALDETYEQVRIHYEGHAFSHDTHRPKASEDPVSIEGIHLFSNDAMQRYMQPEWTRRIAYASFYPPEVEDLFRRLYQDEFDFYQQLGYEFHP